MDLYASLIDLTKLFDIVNKAVWVIMSKLRHQKGLIKLVDFFHEYITGFVVSSGEFLDSFVTFNGVKQG